APRGRDDADRAERPMARRSRPMGGAQRACVWPPKRAHSAATCARIDCRRRTGTSPMDARVRSARWLVLLLFVGLSAWLVREISRRDVARQGPDEASGAPSAVAEPPGEPEGNEGPDGTPTKPDARRIEVVVRREGDSRAPVEGFLVELFAPPGIA